jgi:predicted nucleotidyltransferase
MERSAITLAQLRARRNDIVRIAAAHGAANVRVFGSVARGDASAGSDVDFLVDVPQEYRGFDFFGVLDETREGLEALLGCKVDVISIRGAAAPLARPMAEHIRQEAVPL